MAERDDNARQRAAQRRPSHLGTGEDVLEAGRGRRFKLPLTVTIRECIREDLPALEWFGMFTPHREVIHEAYARQERGENIMLLADMNGAPIGQVWIDLVRRKEANTGFLWAVRVFPWFRRLGIGARLLAAAEDVLRSRGFAAVELGIRKENGAARRFYERLGYRCVGTLQETFSYTTPEGTPVQVAIDEWIMRKHLDGGHCTAPAAAGQAADIS